MKTIGLDRIIIKSDVCLGQPTIRGLRITVAFVFKLLASNLSVPEILEAYPELELEDIIQVTSAKLSEASFAKIWDNPEDAAYDNL